MHLTPEQRAAAEHIQGNLQVIACAGSGKTQVLAERIANILGQAGVRPEQVVAFTFTRKAAGELKERVYRLCRERLGSDRGLADMYVGTIHAFCLDLLQRYLARYLKYSVLTDVQQRLFIDRNSSRCGLTDLQTRDGQKLRRWQDSPLYQRLLGLLREAHLNEAALEGHPAWGAVRKYEALLHAHRYLDYTMIVKEAVVELQGNKELRRQVSERVRYLIVDEYQDVNPLQECLIKLLHDLGAQVCVVGDDDQTIYQWNGSAIENILTFVKRYPQVASVQMGGNFRSTKAIVETARRIAEANAERLPKEMSAVGQQVFERGDLLCCGFRNPDDEASWIARKIVAMRGTPFRDSRDAPERGLSWSDCAVLLRTVKHSAEPIVQAFRAAGIPYVVKGMNRLFETPEVAAATGMFLYLDGQVSADDLRQRWIDANVGAVPADLDAAIRHLDQRRGSWAKPQRKSQYAIQRTYLGFLEDIRLREDRVPCDAHDAAQTSRPEIVFYNLGKFSQVVADYEQVNFHSEPTSLHSGFAGFLVHQAPNYYPEGWEDAAYCRPDAVQVMTVHQAKGTEFPVVFVPSLLQNRFPSRRQGGRQWHHVIPESAVRDADAYRGREEDERRLLYVALTRAKKYLFCTWAPESDKGQYSRASLFVPEITASEYVLTREPAARQARRLPPAARHEEIQLAISFTELRYFFDCPYQFKLRFLYGFRPGAHEELGFGKSLHDALAEIHRHAMAGKVLPTQEATRLAAEHLHLPYAYEKLRLDMAQKAESVLRQYLWDNRTRLLQTEFAEKTIELRLADGLLVSGRIDLIRRLDTNETEIIDFKSNGRSQEEQVTRTQLHVYAMGYRQLTGRDADLVSIYDLDRGAAGSHRETVDPTFIRNTQAAILDAGGAIRGNTFCRASACAGCDFAGICRER